MICVLGSSMKLASVWQKMAPVSTEFRVHHSHETGPWLDIVSLAHSRDWSICACICKVVFTRAWSLSAGLHTATSVRNKQFCPVKNTAHIITVTAFIQPHRRCEEWTFNNNERHIPVRHDTRRITLYGNSRLSLLCKKPATVRWSFTAIFDSEQAFKNYEQVFSDPIKLISILLSDIQMQNTYGWISWMWLYVCGGNT